MPQLRKRCWDAKGGGGRTHGMPAVRLDARGPVDDGRVADVRDESLGGVEVEQAVLILLLWRTLAPPSSKPFFSPKNKKPKGGFHLQSAKDISRGSRAVNQTFRGKNRTARYRSPLRARRVPSFAVWNRALIDTKGPACIHNLI